MTKEWNDSQPIYQQLYELVVGMILDQVLLAGETLPSVRQMSADYKINHLTVAKAYQVLADQQLVENRRGIGMFIKPQARERLLTIERERFLNTDWPLIKQRITRLNINVNELLNK